MSLIDKAKKLLQWNTTHLVHDAEITPEMIAGLFADNFTVKANGRSYAANYQNYQEFLYQFKASIQSIAYEVHEYIEADRFVTLPMTATVTRTNGDVDKFEAILILQFDDEGKIILWHEVYLKI